MEVINIVLIVEVYLIVVLLGFKYLSDKLGMFPTLAIFLIFTGGFIAAVLSMLLNRVENSIRSLSSTFSRNLQKESRSEAEASSGLQKQLGELDERLSEVEKKLANIEPKVEKLNNLSTEFEKLNEKLTAYEREKGKREEKEKEKEKEHMVDRTATGEIEMRPEDCWKPWWEAHKDKINKTIMGKPGHDIKKKELEALDNVENVEFAADGLFTVELACGVVIKLPPMDKPISEASVIFSTIKNYYDIEGGSTDQELSNFRIEKIETPAVVSGDLVVQKGKIALK